VSNRVASDGIEINLLWHFIFGYRIILRQPTAPQGVKRPLWAWRREGRSKNKFGL